MRLWTGAGLTTLLVMLLISPFLVHHVGASVLKLRHVTRLNYGVLFTPVRVTKLMSDSWVHVFDLHLPQISLEDPPFRLTHCDNATSNVEQQMLRRICLRNRAVILTLHKQHVDMIQHIRAALSHVYHLLPVQKSLSGRGQKRSLLPIGGVLLSELFGTTSEADLNPIKEHIGRLAKGYNYLDKGLRMQRHHFSTFVEFTTERLDAFSAQVPLPLRLYPSLHNLPAVD